jgi:ribose transport system ATP-binding protein
MAFAVRGLTKSYSGVPVLQNVDLAVEGGEIHALLGANGAGKSTLIKCVSGAISPNVGEISIDGQTFASLTPKEARAIGVAVIYQDLSIAPSLSVAENIFLGAELRRGPFTRRRAQRAQARVLLEKVGADVDPGATVAELSGADQQVVEIAKALQLDSRLLILDEPTASLTEAEVRVLMSHLRALKEHGLPILYVTHRLGEVFQIADRITVLRDGRVVLSAAVAEITRSDLVEAIVGAGRGGTGQTPGRVRLGTAAPNLPALFQAEGLLAPGIGPIDVSVRPGEVLAVFGLVGSGRTELLEAIFTGRGLRRGELRLEGRQLRVRHPSDAVAAGIALVPSERLRKSLFPPLTSLDNILLPSMGSLAAAGIRSRRRERSEFARRAASVDLKPPRADLQATRYSGGNQQKLVLGRWLRRDRDAKLLLLDEPTQGVDVGARADLYGAIADAVADGTRAVIVTSSDEDEVELLGHRAIVLSRGRLVGELRDREIKQRALLELAHAGE